MRIKARFLEIFRSAFFDLSGWKKRLLQISLLLGGVGVLGQGISYFSEGGDWQAWSWSALTSGFGCLLGFFVGAALRIFLKLALLVGLVVGLLLFGLSWMGWVDLPWETLSEINWALGEYIKEQMGGFQTALTSYLPSSAMTTLGLFSGVTQRPDMNPDD